MVVYTKLGKLTTLKFGVLTLQKPCSHSIEKVPQINFDSTCLDCRMVDFSSLKIRFCSLREQTSLKSVEVSL
jgi:NADPH-dependent 7-cyano-7-deazaguanine reductase QueF